MALWVNNVDIQYMHGLSHIRFWETRSVEIPCTLHLAQYRNVCGDWPNIPNHMPKIYIIFTEESIAKPLIICFSFQTARWDIMWISSCSVSSWRQHTTDKRQWSLITHSDANREHWTPCFLSTTFESMTSVDHGCSGIWRDWSNDAFHSFVELWPFVFYFSHRAWELKMLSTHMFHWAMIKTSCWLWFLLKTKHITLHKDKTIQL